MKPKHKFGSKEFGFLHVAKTGGSSLDEFFRLLDEQGKPTPTVFSHMWTAEQVFIKHKNIQLAIILRDPLIRIISGFNSRLRMGRPLRNLNWTTDEAIAFCTFQSDRKSVV